MAVLQRQGGIIKRRAMERESLLDEELNGFHFRKPKSHTRLDVSAMQKPSMVIDDETQESGVKPVVSKILDQWSLSSPDIIVTFISGTSSFTSWKTEDHRAALQKGIIKLLNATETWIIDSGLDYGISRLIGDAVRNEFQFRQTKREYEVYVRGYLKKRRHAIVLMGVVPVSLLQGAEENQTSDQDTDASLDKQPAFDINSSHTHFIYVKGKNAQTAPVRAMFTVELAAQASERRSATLVPPVQDHEPDTDTVQPVTVCHEQVPLIAVLIQGGRASLEMVHQYLKSGVPVLIIKGTGFLADILAFAFEEYKDRGLSHMMLDIIRRDIAKRLARSFPDTKNDGDLAQMRDKIIDCLVLGSQKEKGLLSVVESSEDLIDLDNYFLPAIFAARPRAVNILKEQVRSDFLLAMKLNKSGLVVSKILGRGEEQGFQVDNDLFEKALLWKGREKFVEKFMEEDFALHRFLCHSQLLRLFRMADDNDFFVTVVWNLLPRGYFDHSIEETFVTRDLNRIVEKLSSFANFLSMHELSSNFLAMFVTNEYDAERKAMNALMVWAVLMGRFNLAKTLWKFCDDPIPLALFVSALYRGLGQHCTDTALVTKLDENGRAFSIMAIDVLDMSYKESNARTFDLLNQKFPDFNDRTPIKVAYASRNKYFLAHEACQIWLNRLWDGGLEITGVWNSGVSEEIKLMLSALLLFPIYFWIQYPAKNFIKEYTSHMVNENALPDNTQKLGNENTGRREKNDRFHVGSDLDRNDSEETVRKLNELAMIEQRDRKSGLRSSIRRLLSHRAQVYSSQSSVCINTRLPFWKKVYYLWSAPRTKFWIFQLFYWFYLALFSVAVILPSDAAIGLDVIVLIWTVFNVVEIALRTMYQMHHGFPFSLIRRGLEIILISAFVLIVAAMKLYPLAVRPKHTRAAMAVGLLYMYYRMVLVFFPMNPILGPMVYRIKRMISVDFLSFVRLALPIILANMFVLQSVMYPDLPFGVETWRKGFYRAFFTLFLAFVSEIDYTPRCEAVRVRNSTYNSSLVGDYKDPTCPTLGVTAYVLNIQYWIFMRLILVVILNALFAATMIKVTQDSEFIFRYQRYRTVLDFASRSALPPPLSVLSYMFDAVMACCVRESKAKDRIVVGPKPIKLLKTHGTGKRSFESYSYWMGLTKEYYRRKAMEEREKKIAQDQITRMKGLADDQNTIKNNLMRLDDKLKQLEKNSLVYFEEIKHSVTRKGHAMEGTLNLISRTSPYPGSGIKRQLIPDHKIPWDVDLPSYDPPKFCRDLDEFPYAQRRYVDPEFSTRRRNDPTYWCWNNVFDRKGIRIDRRTFSKGSGGLTPPEYTLDDRGLPRNIVGRTGMADRGNLHRYGPNHCVQIVLTRYKDDMLRFLVAKNTEYAALPSMFPMSVLIDGQDPLIAAFQILPTLFETVTGESITTSAANEDDMRKLVENLLFADSDSGVSLVNIQQIYSSYLDHSENTDNAWMEAVVWHIDLRTSEGLAKLKSEKFAWKERSNIKRSNPFEEHIMEHVTMSKVVDD